MFSSPTVVGDLVLVGSCKGILYAFDRYNGDVVWEYDITHDGDQANFHGDALVADDHVLIGTDGTGIGHVYCFDWTTGEVRWMYEDVRGVATDIIPFGDHVFATTLGDELICLARDTGELRWSYQSAFIRDELYFNGTPAVAKDAAFFGGMDGTLHAFEPRAGDLKWTQPLASRITTSVMLHDGFVYVGTDAGSLYKIDAASGEIVGELETLKVPSQAIVDADSDLAVFLDWAQPTSEIAAFDLELRGFKWRRAAPAGDRWTSARPYAVDGDIVVGSELGEVHAYDASTGALRWSLKVDGTVRGMGFNDDAIFVGTLNGMVYCVAKQW